MIKPFVGLTILACFAGVCLNALKPPRPAVFDYQKTIKTFGHIPATGPDKAFFRDLIMTMNPATGQVPKLQSPSGANRQRSSSRDLQWTPVPTQEVAGRMRTFMVDPNNGKRLWAGSVTGGLWVNEDFRNNEAWQPLSDDWESMSISSITHDPTNTQVFYVGTGESFTSVPIYRESSSSGIGIYKTQDGGETWSLLPSTSEFDYINDVLVREENGQGVIYAAVASGVYQGKVFASSPTDGLYRSADGGESWEQVLPNIPGETFSYAVSDIESTAKGEIYVGTMRNLLSSGGGVVLRSTDGLNWTVDNTLANSITSLGSNIIPGRVVLTAGQEVVYAVGMGGQTNVFGQIRDLPNFTRVFKQAGESWQQIPDPFTLSEIIWANIPWHAMALAVDPSDDDNLIIGALDLYATTNATPSASSLDWQQLSTWRSAFEVSPRFRSVFGVTDPDSLISKHVHGDIHQISFIDKGQTEILIATDGGIYYSGNIHQRDATTSENSEEVKFQDVNNGLSTLQYYTTALTPVTNSREVLAGAQDNHTFTTTSGKVDNNGTIGLGDGAFCFFDSNNLNLRLTSSQVNNYYIFIDDQVFFPPFMSGGSFINPGEYDDRLNLLYTNQATDGGFHQLVTILQGRLLDTLLILNVNKYLGSDDLGLDTITYLNAGTNSQAAFSAFKLSPHTVDSTTLVVGNQLGDIYKITGLPWQPVARKIDGGQLPVGYISSIDIGTTEDHILATISNYDVASVWFTRDGGEEWINLERDLPNFPVRYGLFNPNDNNQIVIATEKGIWGLENIRDDQEGWTSYNENFPNIRVDMIKARKSDSTIVAATHGRGLFLGKLSQGEIVLSSPHQVTGKTAVTIYPNPSSGILNISSDQGKVLRLFQLNGGLAGNFEVTNHVADISTLRKGFYITHVLDEDGQILNIRKILKE